MTLGQVAADQGDDTLAYTLLGECLALCRQAGNAHRIGGALVSLARLDAARGEGARAMARWREALAHYRATPMRIGRAWCLEGLAWGWSSRGHAGRAARLLGAAAGIREGIGAPHSVPECAWYEPLCAGLRSALGDMAYAAAWEAGRAMSEEAAFELALAD